MDERLKDFGADLLDLVPEILLFLLILIVGLVLAKVLAKGTDALLNKLRVNRMFSRNVEQATSRRVAWNIVGVLSKVVFWLVVLFTLYFAFGVFGEDNAFFILIASIVAFLPELVTGILLLVVAFAIAGVVRDLINSSLRGLSYGSTVANVAGGLIVGFGILAALTQIGVANAILLPLYTFFLVTIAGILIVGVGGALAVTLRPLTARMLTAAEDELTDAANEVTTTGETDNPDNRVSTPAVVEPVPHRATPAVVDPVAPPVTPTAAPPSSPPRLTRRNRGDLQ